MSQGLSEYKWSRQRVPLSMACEPGFCNKITYNLPRTLMLSESGERVRPAAAAVEGSAERIKIMWIEYNYSKIRMATGTLSHGGSIVSYLEQVVRGRNKHSAASTTIRDFIQTVPGLDLYEGFVEVRTNRDQACSLWNWIGKRITRPQSWTLFCV